MKALSNLFTAAIAVMLAGAALPAAAEDPILAGTDRGLYRIGDNRQDASPLWERAGVRKIIRTADRWYFLTGAGVVTSADLVSFEERNAGLPVKVVKEYNDGKKSFVREVQELKDLEVHPSNPLILVTATKDAVFLTRDGGATWTNLGISAATAGVKAVAVLDLPDATGVPRLTVFMSHPIYGVSWRQMDVKSSAWADLDAGLEKVPSIKWPDEVADLAADVRSGTSELYVSQTFMPRVYRLDWAGKKFIPVWKGTAFLETVEDLVLTPSTIVFTAPGGIREIGRDQALPPAAVAPAGFKPSPAIQAAAAAVAANAQKGDDGSTPLGQYMPRPRDLPGNVLAYSLPARNTDGRGPLAVSELWLASPASRSGTYTATARGRKGNYLPVHQVTTDAGFDAHIKTLEANRLNMLVVDMKDDVGVIRYDSKDPLVLRKGKFGKGVQLDPFVKKAKDKGIYLVARIVVFKDKALSSWGGSKYAIWDRAEGKPWQGYEIVSQKVAASTDPSAAQTEKVRKYIEEYWVDPYCEEVWEYNIAIAKELVARGFDEIQFDYIRFPTDGANLGNTSFRWQDSGMDKESALMSFLSYARREIAAPISIDIYGANGWYRTGARTGQDVELLARYVDVICPMFYPSHFEQGFLAQNPAQERPYRIYYYGSYRNTIIARNHVVVRPWAQAFYLNVSFDRAWYNADYVQRQIFGTRDSIDQGYTYWNNSGRYADLRPDVDSATPYPWELPEAYSSGGKPSFGSK